MITTPTVLILGAGASCPYGFPTAKELKALICNAFSQPESGVSQFLAANNKHSADEFREFGNAFLKSGQSSVDAFLEHRPDLLDVGKLAIAYCLVPFEDEAKLYQPVGNDWYGYLSEKLNATFEEFGNNKLSIITFNYDRSLEHFLLNSLHYSHGKKFEECAETLAKIPIIHVYGQLGEATYPSTVSPGYRPEHDQRYSAYRPDRNRLINVGAAGGITLLHEEDSGGAQAARDVLKAATRICFLGFSYHPMNVDRLNIGGCLDLRTTVIGTARGLLGMEIPQAESRVRRAIGGDIHLREGEDSLDILRRNIFLDPSS